MIDNQIVADDVDDSLSSEHDEHKFVPAVVTTKAIQEVADREKKELDDSVNTYQNSKS